MHRASTVGILVLVAACSGTPGTPGTQRGPHLTGDGDRPEPAGSAKDPQRVVATGHIPELPSSVTLADLTPPASAPTGTPLSLPVMPWRAGERHAVWTTSGGHDAAEVDTYEAVQTINAIDVEIVTDASYEILSASMNSMGGRSALQATYRIKFDFDRAQRRPGQVSFQDGEGRELPTGLAREELTELGDRTIMMPWSELRALHDVPLREGETKTLDADEKKALQVGASNDIWFARLPDKAGIAIFRIYQHQPGDDASIWRAEVRYDARANKPVRFERISTPRNDLTGWYIVATEFGPS